MSKPSAVSAGHIAGAIIGGRYRVERLLGKGGVGSVFAVVDRSNGQPLALKRLRADAGERAAAFFEREYRILSGLQHPGIVEVHDYAVDDEGAYYTMELVDGRDLSLRAPIPWRAACAYLRDAASILGLLHARRLLHRDISPRNLIECKSGRLKLIDFGALADFGPSPEIVGTPPFVPPEALTAGSLDQRADLFSLGALGYWLVTGHNAFAARTLSELPDLWQREPTPASVLVQQIGNDLLEAPPPELDDLLAMLLSIEPRERIASTAELIDRLNVIAELAPEPQEIAVQAYLHSKAFVGRERERTSAGDALIEARHAHGQLILIDGERGIGRSRFVQELALTAQLDGAFILSAHPTSGRRPYALAESMLAQLYRALPRQTRELMAPHEEVLAPISPLRGDYGTGTFKKIQVAGATRARLQNALFDVFFSLAQTHFLALVIDDLHEVDEESRALLTALSHRRASLRLCLIASFPTDPQAEPAPAIASVRGAQRIRLAPLSAAETRELLQSVFGDVAYLDRSSERLHHASHGNPGHCLELAQHLVQIGAARYTAGGWTLPTDLPVDSLPGSREAGLFSRVDRLAAPAKSLARVLSIPHSGSWALEQAAAAAELAASEIEALLATLARERILERRDDGYAWIRNEVREKLLAELPSEERRAIHARVARALTEKVRSEGVAHALRASIHWLHAADYPRAAPVLKQFISHLLAGDPAQIGLHAAEFEEVVVLLRELRQDDYALCGPLGMLAVSGYFCDRRYAAQYGESALESLQHVLRLSLARRLAPRLGGKLALFVALSWAGSSLALRFRRALSVQQVVQTMLLAASTLAGTAAICIDPDRAARYASAIEPFAALGSNHAATLVYDFSMLMSLQGRDRPARCSAAMQAMIDRLADPRPIREMTDIIRESYYAGTHLTLGVFVVRRDDRDGLAVADKLESFSPLYAMSADHLRASYYAGQGDAAHSELWRRRMEVHAVQLGSAWQVETWAPIDVMNIAMRLHDAAEMKRALQELERLSPEVPSLAVQELNARISYLVLRGKYADALELAATRTETAFSFVGWMRTQGTLARAHNALGQHERARQLCLDALAGADPDDLRYVVMNLGVPIELAIAEAGLGDCALAHAQLEKLLAEHTPNESAVTLGSLHEAQARVSLAERDFAQARIHLNAAFELYRPLGIASLIERGRAVARQIDFAEDPDALVRAQGDSERYRAIKGLKTRVQLMLRQRLERCEHSRACLEIALEFSDADRAFLVLAGSAEEEPACLGCDPPVRDVVSWARESLRVAPVEADTVMTAADARRSKSDLRVFGTTHYRVAPLSTQKAGAVAVLVLGSENGVPTAPEAVGLQVLADQLARAS